MNLTSRVQVSHCIDPIEIVQHRKQVANLSQDTDAFSYSLTFLAEYKVVIAIYEASGPVFNNKTDYKEFVTNLRERQQHEFSGQFTIRVGCNEPWWFKHLGLDRTSTSLSFVSQIQMMGHYLARRQTLRS